MQDLTFGEQVKIILSRKNMTIKELARKMERRTGKKMSRQNLTQRLGRDNFQEQDMRVIAEILECPFQLNILEEIQSAKPDGVLLKEAVLDPEAGAMVSEGDLEKKTETIQKAEPGTTEMESVEPEAAEVKAAGAKAVKSEAMEVKAEESEATEVKAAEIEATEMKAAETEAMEAKAAETEATEAKAAETETMEAKAAETEAMEAKAAETEAMESKAAESEAIKVKATEAKAIESKAVEPEGNAGKKIEIEKASAEGKKERGREFGNAANERDMTIGELVDIHEKLDELMEKAAGKLPGAEVFVGESREGVMRTEAVLEGRYGEEAFGIYGEYAGDGSQGYQRYAEEVEGEADGYFGEYVQEAGSESVEELLEEIEALEKTERKEEKKEEKPHGWKAYLIQRFKKLSKPQPGQPERELPEAEKAEKAEDEVAKRLAEGMYMVGNLEEGNPDGRSEDVYEQRSEEGNPGEGYSTVGYGEEDPANGYRAEGYSEESQQEDVQGRGDINPYTGKEYETNSVRMHPSRIGYVQVYDRAHHGWTDMTEWAFLGYQERKKQLLGKDYDPPIYLD